MSTKTKIIAKNLISHFQHLTHTCWQPSLELIKELEKYLANFSFEHLQEKSYIENSLIYIINDRMGLNKDIYRLFIDKLANNNQIFNYHQKIQIEANINKPETNFIDWCLLELKIDENLKYFLQEIEEKRNKDFINLDKYLHNDEKYAVVIESIFCSYIYYCIDEKNIHKILNKDCQIEYFNNYWHHLQKFHASQISREKGLVIIDLDSSLNEDILSYEKVLKQTLNLVEKTYNELTNHCYFAIIIGDNFSCKWQLIADITIFSEKFIEYHIDKTYFRWKEIAEKTSNYIKNLDINACKFQDINEGFAYKDCYLVYKDNSEKCVLIFEKNDRDERQIPCPQCRTFHVQGNSYPTLGVRSWECKNIFCGDKSKYNRGKRYSLSSIIRQQAILDDRNILEKELLKKWRRDIVKVSKFTEIYDFLIKCYSLYDDTVIIYGYDCYLKENLFGRKIKVVNARINSLNLTNLTTKDYMSLSFFKRFLVNKDREFTKLPDNLSPYTQLDLYNGDAFQVLCNLKSNSLGGAVTSPPYYNARDYANWNNIYCYLYDMYNIAQELYRCLKPGSPCLFNIFDYFDNENIIVFSDMGKKRLILSSYISFIFRYIGFEQIGNIAWDKGEIESNRNFNQGNYSPYYQAPLNCWEHILVFSKGQPSFNVLKLTKVIRETPVIKIIKGKNIHGHTAPFPEAIPKLLFSLIPEEETIIDPFTGSMTTGRAAIRKNRKSINIELHKEYCDLALDLLKKQMNEVKQMRLFD